MPYGFITLNGVQYMVAHANADGTGPLRWSQSARPSELGDPSIPQEAFWEISGPQLNSFEVLGPDGTGLLSTDYTDGCDTRWDGSLTLGPQLNTVTLSTHDGANTPANVNGFAVAPTSMNATGPFLYVIRGIPVAKLDKTMALVNPGTVIALGENATSILYSKAVTAEEISIGMAGTAYEVITAVANAGTADTHAANSSASKQAILAQGTDRIAGLNGVTAQGNIMTGSVTMAAPNWNTVATVNGTNLKMTGFSTVGNLWVFGTNYGPYFVDPIFNTLYPLASNIAPDDANCSVMIKWFIDCLYSTKNAFRWVDISGQGASMGVENFTGNTSPVTGPVTGGCATDRWAYLAIQNPQTSDTWLTAWRPTVGHAGHWDPFVIGRLKATDCKAMINLDTMNGARTSPTVAYGHGSDMGYFLEGVNARQIEDPNYQYQNFGTWYGTEMRRYPHMIKDLRFVEADAPSVNVGFITDQAVPTFRNVAQAGLGFPGGSPLATSVWALSDASGTAAIDNMGIQNGVYVGAPSLAQPSIIPTETNTSVLFNGSSQSVTVAANTLYNSASFSMFVWMQFAKLPSGSFGLFGKNDTTSWQCEVDSFGAINIRINGVIALDDIGDVIAGQTFMIGIIYDDTTKTLTAKTNAKTSVFTGVALLNTVNAGFVFANTAAGTGWFGGHLQDVAYWNTAISTQVAEQLYSGGLGVFVLSGTQTWTGGSNGPFPSSSLLYTPSAVQAALVDDALVPWWWAACRSVKPVLYLSAAQKATGRLRLSYALRPMMTMTYAFTLLLVDTAAATAKEQAADLLDLWGAGPVTMTEDIYGVQYSVRIDSVVVTEQTSTGAGLDNPALGHTMLAVVNATLWPSLTTSALTGSSA